MQIRILILIQFMNFIFAVHVPIFLPCTKAYFRAILTALEQFLSFNVLFTVLWLRIYIYIFPLTI